MVMLREKPVEGQATGSQGLGRWAELAPEANMREFGGMETLCILTVW